MSFILLVEQAAPQTPSANQVVFYAKSDGLMYSKNDAGTESNLQSIFAAGTRMLFQQTSAPTGWTKEVSATYNGAALRFQTGTVTTGGADAFTTVFGTGKSTASYTLATAEIPSHTHTTPGRLNNMGGGESTFVNSTNPTADNNVTSSATGGGGSHAHTLSNMNLAFADCIIAQKD